MQAGRVYWILFINFLFMREIKFRAWREKNELKEWHMISWEQIKHNTNYNLFWWYFELFNRREFVPMQYTWLKDKNWNEIYDGDLIKYSWNSRIWEIYFDTENLQFRMKSTDKSAKIETVHRYQFHELWTLEIIWNIYENPELLKS